MALSVEEISRRRVDIEARKEEAKTALALVEAELHTLQEILCKHPNQKEWWGTCMGDSTHFTNCPDCGRRTTR